VKKHFKAPEKAFVTDVVLTGTISAWA